MRRRGRRLIRWLLSGMAIVSLMTHSWGQDTEDWQYEECKLSRPGPPATIVTIDEESTNGTVWWKTCRSMAVPRILAEPFL